MIFFTKYAPAPATPLRNVTQKITRCFRIHFNKESEKLLKMVVNLMESAVELSVPLVVDVERGVSWGSVG